MEEVFENKIDSERIITNWIDNAARIWETMVRQNKETHNAMFNGSDGETKAYQAWEPALKTWKQFASTINKKEMIESIVEQKRLKIFIKCSSPAWKDIRSSKSDGWKAPRTSMTCSKAISPEVSMGLKFLICLPTSTGKSSANS